MPHRAATAVPRGGCRTAQRLPCRAADAGPRSE